MAEPSSAADFMPERRSIKALADAAAGCEGCDLYRDATQTVFGDGARNASILFVGEQPGDEEDQQGEPFVGPAGRILDHALDRAGVDRSSVYVTNAVKHFRFEERGKQRIHKKPNGGQIEACKPWLMAEIEAVAPDLVVTLGATASQALLGKDFRVTKQRGEIHHLDGGTPVTATVHPSSVLRAPDDRRDDELERFVVDVRDAFDSVT